MLEIFQIFRQQITEQIPVLHNHKIRHFLNKTIDFQFKSKFHQKNPQIAYKLNLISVLFYCHLNMKEILTEKGKNQKFVIVTVATKKWQGKSKRETLL